MRIYGNRFSSDYISAIQGFMDIECLKKNAISIRKLKIYKKKKYDKLIRVDYIGIGATVLFDVNQKENNVFDQVHNLLDSVKSLNDDGYFVKFRILLEYPHSITSYSRKIAEIGSERASINEPEYFRNFQMIYSSLEDLTECIDDEALEQAYLVTSQKEMLKQIDWVNKTFIDNKEWNQGLNKFTLRFIPFDPLMSCLYINNNIYYSVYLLAKQNRGDDRLLHMSPVVNISSRDDYIVKVFDDHFRYLWCLGVTMDSSDVSGNKGNMKRVKSPENIDYNDKALRIRQEGKLNGKHFSHAQEEIWKFFMRNALQYLCAPIHNLPKRETLFISCVWRTTDSGQTMYDDDVVTLRQCLEDDFTEDDIKLLNVELTNVSLGKGIRETLYPSLEKATIGLVLATIKTKDKNGKYYSSPNVYHELGYLMRHVKDGGIIILQEKKRVTIANKKHDVTAELPTNISDFARIPYKKGTLYSVYPDIVEKICEFCFSPIWFERVMNKYKERLNERFMNNEINKRMYNSINAIVDRKIKEIGRGK